MRCTASLTKTQINTSSLSTGSFGQRCKCSNFWVARDKYCKWYRGTTTQQNHLGDVYYYHLFSVSAFATLWCTWYAIKSRKDYFLTQSSQCFLRSLIKTTKGQISTSAKYIRGFNVSTAQTSLGTALQKQPGTGSGLKRRSQEGTLYGLKFHVGLWED